MKNKIKSAITRKRFQKPRVRQHDEVHEIELAAGECMGDVNASREVGNKVYGEKLMLEINI